MAITEEQRRQFAQHGQQAVAEEQARLAQYKRDTRRGADTLDEALAFVPGVNELSGASVRVADRDRRSAEQRAQDEIARLGAAPSIEQLTGGPYGQETALQLGPSQGAQAAADPLAVEAQRRALQQLQGLGDQRGLSTADQQATQGATVAVTQAQAGQRQQQQAALAARGMAGSGAEIRSLFGGDQGAGAMGQASGDIQRAAQQRALAALAGAGTVAGQIRGQSFGEAFKRGESADDTTAWNALNRQDVGNRNVNWQNQRIDNQRQAYRDRFGIQERRAALQTGQQDWQGAQEASRERAAAQRTGNYVAGGAKLLKKAAFDDDEEG